MTRIFEQTEGLRVEEPVRKGEGEIVGVENGQDIIMMESEGERRGDG